MKKQRGGKVSRAQEEALSALRKAGYRAEVCKGWQAAREVIETYLKGA